MSPQSLLLSTATVPQLIPVNFYRLYYHLSVKSVNSNDIFIVEKLTI